MVEVPRSGSHSHNTASLDLVLELFSWRDSLGTMMSVWCVYVRSSNHRSNTHDILWKIIRQMCITFGDEVIFLHGSLSTFSHSLLFAFFADLCNLLMV